jgi:hypothetical protein
VVEAAKAGAEIEEVANAAKARRRMNRRSFGSDDMETLIGN